MTQAIINNAAAISYDRDVTVASTTSASRNLKWFRKSPFQTIVQVDLNVMLRDTYQGILADLSSNLIGPYTFTLPKEVVGAAHEGTINVVGSSQTGNSINVVTTVGTVTLTKGTIIQFPGVALTYVLRADTTVTTSAIPLVVDQPVAESPTNGAAISTGSDITFNMHLVERPRASFGPTGLVVHDGSFRFSEVTI